jgi:hypothetical protein
MMPPAFPEIGKAQPRFFQSLEKVRHLYSRSLEIIKDSFSKDGKYSTLSFPSLGNRPMTCAKKN